MLELSYLAYRRAWCRLSDICVQRGFHVGELDHGTAADQSQTRGDAQIWSRTRYLHGEVTRFVDAQRRANRRCAVLSRSVQRPKGAALTAMLGAIGWMLATSRLRRVTCHTELVAIRVSEVRAVVVFVVLGP